MKVNIHGLIGIVAIAAMISICVYKNQDIPCLYVMLGSAGYLGMILSINQENFSLDEFVTI